MTRQTTFARCTGVRRLISRYLVLLVALIFSALLFSGVRVEAGSGDLDPSFNGGGIAGTHLNEFEQINDIVIQPDGKIVAVGGSGISHEGDVPQLDIMVTRFNIDGSLDATFGNNGIVITRVLLGGSAMAVALQQDGKIVVASAASTLDRFSGFTLVRYHTDGSRDLSFGFGGIVQERRFRTILRSRDLVVQSDGKIVVTGEANFSGIPGDFTAVLARFEEHGNLDVTFGAGGVSDPLPAGFVVSPMASFNGIALQADQKIVVAGNCHGTFCLSRYNADGSLDNSFNGTGLVAAHRNFSADEVNEAVRLQPDGKIVVVGQGIHPFFGFVPVLARFNIDGSIDTTFGSDGGTVTIFDTAPFTQFRVESLALKPNGKIVIVGKALFFNSSETAMRVAFCSSEGVLEEIVTTPVGTSSAANAVAAQPDGKIVVGGYGSFFTFSGGVTFSASVVARYGTNSAPVVSIASPESGSVFAVNTPIEFAGMYSDDFGDTHTAEWIFESTTQPGTTVVPAVANLGSVVTTHTFTEPGVYKVSLKVTDDHLLSGTATTVSGLEALVVIYDPDGGWVAGGGWIDSPVGAYSLLPELSGKANFGFVSKYQTGASTPTGSVEFQFNAAGLKFQSKSFEWLVISGGRKAQYKGAGTINGGGSYHFMLTAIDGDQPGGDGQDKFRIRIWSDGDGLIYDNQLNAPNGDDPTTMLGGGSIVIHR